MSIQGFPDDGRRHSASKPYKRISTGGTNAVSIKASAGVITGYFISNDNASPVYVKLYDKASAPNVGTDVPVWTLRIPGSASANVQMTNPLAFDVGIAMAFTGGVADGDSTAVGANDVVANIAYQ